MGDGEACEAKVEGMWGGAAVGPAMGSTAAEVKMGDGEACEANGSVCGVVSVCSL